MLNRNLLDDNKRYSKFLSFENEVQQIEKKKVFKYISNTLPAFVDSESLKKTLKDEPAGIYPQYHFGTKIKTGKWFIFLEEDTKQININDKISFFRSYSKKERKLYKKEKKKQEQKEKNEKKEDMKKEEEIKKEDQQEQQQNHTPAEMEVDDLNKEQQIDKDKNQNENQQRDMQKMRKEKKKNKEKITKKEKKKKKKKKIYKKKNRKTKEHK